MTRLSPQEREDDSFKSYGFAIQSLREICIRRGSICPTPGHQEEERWAREGERKPSELDCVRGRK